MIEQIKPGAQAQGLARWVVRGSRFLPLDQAAALRAFYNEYPERFPFNPLFPEPGQRGGSPAPKSTGSAARAGGAGAGAGAGGAPAEGEPGTESTTVVVSPYPLARPRDGSEIPGGSGLPSYNADNASSINSCAGEGGIHIQFAQAVLAGTTDRRITQRFSRPFIIRYVSVWSDATDVSNSRTTIRITPNNDTSAGGDADGVQLDEGAIGLADFGVVNAQQQSFPNKRVTNVPAFLKFITVNGTAAVLQVQVIINIEWLD